MCFARKWLLLLVMLSLAACSNSDLSPSGEDRRPGVDAGTTGSAVGQKAPDFIVPDTNGGAVTLTSALAGKKAMVMYFTMWCPICDSHMSLMQSATIPSNPNVRFFAVDYVSGSIAEAKSAEVANGFAGTGFTVLVDVSHTLLQSYQATMGTTIVIDSGGLVKMNEDFGSGARLQAVLTSIP
jgi:peroxiredoxin